ncbi:hypothetical protein [Salipiger marinus]|uniref:5-methylcytosine-specific restriction enzyme subunit McrC n=1 Tax=Salipiger marinus TaxID=555512 RepID=A0A1G8U867_9RHOB|nr:hypothetical protein [Salipiger marinus]SDJ50006.1 hypothetical protein SAMN04487993_103719 [Salipiger marinus]
MSLDAAIVDHTAGLLLRYFRSGAAIEGAAPRLDQRRDVDILKGHWAVSAPVRQLTAYLLAHPHETQALLSYRERVDDAVARGRLDARRTWFYRQQSGIPSALVTHEPVRSFNTGPNLLLAWVLREAASYTARLFSWQGTTSPYLPTIEKAQADIRSVQKIDALREPLRAVSLGHRPNAASVRDAARSRRQVYRLAVDAYRLLQGLERGEADAMDRVARSALIAPLEDWRRFELAVGLSIGEALAQATGGSLHLHLLGAKSSGPIVTAGRFAIYWQQITGYHQPPPLEPSELRVRAVLQAYGINTGTERPDLIVVDRDQDAVAAVVEVKYIAGDTATTRFREAVDQVVRYGRSYAPTGATAPLLSRSLVALSRHAPARIDPDAPAPFSVDFEALKQPHGLDAWALALLALP